MRSMVLAALALSVASFAAAFVSSTPAEAQRRQIRYSCVIGAVCCHRHLWPREPRRNYSHCHRYPGRHRH